nr:hypothetical protein [Tanacetum cinerariifolium]
MMKKSLSLENEPCFSKDCRKNTESLNNKIDELKNDLYEANIYRHSYNLGIDQLEGRLAEYKEREVKYIEIIRTLEMNKEYNLGKIKKRTRYNVVPPPAADLYRSPKKDLSWTGLPEFADDTVTDYSRPSATVESTSTEGQNKHSTTAENGESTDSILSKPAVKFVKAGDRPPERPTTNKAEFMKAAERPTTNKVETAKKTAVRYVELYRRTSKRETTRSQNHAYKSPSHRSYGAPMRPLHRPAGHRPHGPLMRPMRSNMNGARPKRLTNLTNLTN